MIKPYIKNETALDIICSICDRMYPGMDCEPADCEWLKDEVCVNSDCPAVADFCPVVNHPGVCRYEEIDE